MSDSTNARLTNVYEIVSFATFIREAVERQADANQRKKGVPPHGTGGYLMPSREFRKCETCEWSEERGADTVRCRNKTTRDDYTSADSWCSEWKSAEPETCSMCHWFNEDAESCNHSIGAVHCDVTAAEGACEHLRRVK